MLPFKNLIVHLTGISVLPSLRCVPILNPSQTDNGNIGLSGLTTSLGNFSLAKSFFPLPGEIYALMFPE